MTEPGRRGHWFCLSSPYNDRMKRMATSTRIDMERELADGLEKLLREIEA